SSLWVMTPRAAACPIELVTLQKRQCHCREAKKPLKLFLGAEQLRSFALVGLQPGQQFVKLLNQKATFQLAHGKPYDPGGNSQRVARSLARRTVRSIGPTRPLQS